MAFIKCDPIADWDKIKRLRNIEGVSNMYGLSIFDGGSEGACPFGTVVSTPFSAPDALRPNVCDRHGIQTTRVCLDVLAVPLRRTNLDAQHYRQRQIDQVFDGKRDFSF
jgi:hypothetical protein